MRSVALLLGLGIFVPGAVAQQVWVYGPANTKPATPAPGSAANATAPGKPVIVYHELGSSSSVESNSTAEELVELRGVRKRVEYNQSAIMVTEKRNVLHNFPNLNPDFVDEWARRVSAKMNADDYVAIAARVYASHFTDDELAKWWRE